MWNFFATYATQIVGVIAAVLIIADLIVDFRRRSSTRNWILVASTVVSVFAFFWLIWTTWEPKSEWVLWREKVDSGYHDCLSKNKALIVQSFDRDDLGYGCLSLVLESIQMPTMEMRKQSSETISTDANPHLNLNQYLINQMAGYELLQLHDVSVILKQRMGLYSNLFLGAGHTLPFKDLKNEGNDLNPGIREYLVKNYCIGDWPQCPKQMLRIRTGWGWELDPVEIETDPGDVTIGGILSSKDPNLNGDPVSRADWVKYREYVARYMEKPDPNDRILIRLAQFPRDGYVGTLGLPKRKFSFFTDIRDVWKLNYKDAILASGLIANPNPNSASRIYIWVVKVSPTTNESGLASWDYIVQTLRENAADAKNHGIKL